MTYHLQIVTPDGQRFDGQAECLTVPTIHGQMGILARHVNCVAALGMGPAKVTAGESERRAACIGGMLAVTEVAVRVAATSFEWADEIDIPRARASLARGEAMLADPNADARTKQRAQARIERAQVRLRVAANR